MTGAVITHNHPENEGDHTFGVDDFNLFIDSNMSVLRGIEKGYLYELRRGVGVAPKLPIKTIFEVSEEDVVHYKMDTRAREVGFYYERKQRNNGKS